MQNTAAANYPYGSLPGTVAINNPYGQYAAPPNSYAYQQVNNMNSQRPQFPFYTNQANIQPPQAHLYAKSSSGNAPYQNNNQFQQGQLPMLPVYPVMPVNMQPVYPAAPVNTAEVTPVPQLTVNSTGNDTNVTSDLNGQPLTGSDSNDVMVAAGSPVNSSVVPLNLQPNLVSNQYTSLFNTLPMKQPFYPPGYGPSNPFVLSSYNPMSGATNTTSVWSMPQPFYTPSYATNPYYNPNPVPSNPMNPYYPPSTVPNNPMNLQTNVANMAANSLQGDDSSSPTIISSNGETGSDINSLPPQVKEFVDMIPDILSMPESQQFSHGQSGLFRGSTQPTGPGGLHKAKSSLFKKKHYMPRRYYSHY